MVQIASYGPWAVVTGASSGIGRAFAEQLAAQRLHLVLAARSTDRLESLGRALSEAHGIHHRVIPVDLGEPGSASVIVDGTADLDVGLLISNAGSAHPGRFLEQDPRELHRRLALNAGSHLDLAHPFGKRFVARGRGGFIFVSALGARHGLPNLAQDGAAKGYLINLGEALHYELAAHGIDVTVMLPGIVETPAIDAVGLKREWLPMRPQPAEAAVRETLAAFLKRRPMHVPGLAVRIFARIVPRRQSIRLNTRLFDRALANLAQRATTQRETSAPPPR